MSSTNLFISSGVRVMRRAAEHLSARRLDLLLVAILLFAGIAASFLNSGRLNPQLVQPTSKPYNTWFQGDLTRVSKNMTERWSDHYRTKVHPLFSLATNPVIHLLKKTGLEPLQAVRIFTALLAGIWLGAVYVLIRLVGVRRPDAVLFALLAGTSSSFLFWTAVPETFLTGSLSMVVVLGFVALGQRTPFSAPWYVGMSALSLSMTITNWMVGIFATLVNHPLRRSIRITLDAFLVITLLWAIQKVLYPSAQYFLGDREELEYVFLEVAGGPLHKAAVFFVHSMVMPAIELAVNPGTAFWPMLTIQRAAIGSSGPAGALASLLWLMLLVLGAWAAIRSRGNIRMALVLGLTLVAQFLLHLVYGDETFLYSLHWLPFLVVLGSLATLAPGRRYVLAAAALLVVLTVTNNSRQFLWAADTLSRYPSPGTGFSERHKLISSIETYPEADWPRGEGHVLIAATGSPLAVKGYHEPGGSFSPGYRSFGISIAVLAEENKSLQLSSNSVPLADLRQQLVPVHGKVVTRTPYYSTAWRSMGQGSYLLSLDSVETEGLRIGLRVSSAGPAGGPINSIKWDGRSLLVNQRWQLAISPAPVQVFFQDERKPVSLSGERPTSEIWEPEDGFASALLVLGPSSRHQLLVKDIPSEPAPAVSDVAAIAAHPLPLPEIRLPDDRFAESIAAQLFHLQAGIVGNQTRPGDPGNYPLNWLRDGAYSVVALARAGDLDLANRLAWDFAERDFFGGFGAEADAPGLAIWVLDEVSTRISEPDFDLAIWPHVERKAAIIEELLAAVIPVVKPFDGPIVPSLRNKSYLELATIASPAKAGLITGKMDWHQPVFYVNAVSYLGLMRAAELATRLGFDQQAAHWRHKAAMLQESWGDALLSHPDRVNDRTVIAGMWPSRIAQGRAEGEYLKLLASRWEQRRTEDGAFLARPLWTYFEVAEAHQWLLLGRPEQTWKTLDWFWQHQASPGLYTWWEGDGEENTFEQWKNVRGWVRPAHVTPHYWTGAEMLLLQLNMLAFETEKEGQPAIVIGAGIPEHWLEHDMSVHGLSMRSGNLDWTWDGRRMSVCWHGGRPPQFVLGPSFGVDTEIVVAAGPEKQNKEATRGGGASSGLHWGAGSVDRFAKRIGLAEN
jgi:hypothetical protein